MAKEKRKKPPTGSEGKTIVFLHPDLGIGGAERLVVDAAVGLQKRGHRVVIFTSHCDPSHCFDEARDGTLDVRVRGNTIVPPSILSRFSILCAILRQIHLILQIAIFSSELADLQPDGFFVDQLSAGLPLLAGLSPQLNSPPPHILFYCHFPDLLLAQGRQKWWKRLYRVPFDRLEEWSMGFADAIAVNSGFTKGVVSRTWPALAAKTDLQVVYPCVDVRVPGEPPKEGQSAAEGNKEDVTSELDWKESRILLSINRFERKKNVALAIKAYAGLPKEKRAGVKLVIAGGYDNRVPENVSYHTELTNLADSLDLRHGTTKTVVTALGLARDPSIDVLFLQSVPSALKTALLRSAKLLLYTPAEEHFGIVPLEAMLAGLPVLACDSGGPTETVLEGVTGWLRSPEKPEEWTKVVDMVLNELSDEQKDDMRAAGPKRVKENFAEEQMAERLDRIFDDMEQSASVRQSGSVLLISFGLVSLAVVAFVVSLLMKSIVG
ncbi:mannosyltransferase [Pyricularia oryzae 70-15]|uniref:Alpha-1,3/1,6-mannosyltransferase ALG2 n=1 Tax=Pyricularia oryzae (strain 70-15 / ATCC MYA-4617 / FGSC 8958) TaxID=242507 RepID=G4MR13_PYRO7|nr:mannosyltransferase [Pyricularia oryzae 70-15]EHA56548.1 mannosyltransferase [Pyricularia oryzae 70-15]KAI7910977.1 mannosyltransferase [Pyricularia oryzae]